MATARRLASGNFRVRVYIGKNADGKPQYKSFTAPTKKEAEFLAAQYNQANISIGNTDLTLAQAIKKYIDSKANVLSPSTVRGYRSNLRNLPEVLLYKKLNHITQDFVQEVFNEYALTHSPKMCRNIHGLVSTTLKTYRPDLVLNTTLPQKDKKGIYVPDEIEVKKIWELAKGTIIEIPFILATQCGLRASEIAGLTKNNISPSFVTVKQAAVIGDDNTEYVKKPKSNAGFRKIPITQSLYDLIMSKCENERIVPQRAPVISNDWGNFRKKHALPEDLNFHALRHHFASKCLLLGMPQKYIAELMGHNSLDMIEKVYQHIFPSAMEKYTGILRDNIDALLQPKNGI